jgi:hypothetical protein
MQVSGKDNGGDGLVNGSSTTVEAQTVGNDYEMHTLAVQLSAQSARRIETAK